MKTKQIFIYFVTAILCLIPGNVDASESCPSGLIWNSHINECLNSADDNRINNKKKYCDSKAAGTTKDDCNKMVQSFAKNPKDYVEYDGATTTDKEKKLKSLGTAATSAIAAFKLFKAYKAAKSAKDVFSNMCISGMISIATGVMSFMNDKNIDKQVKETIAASKKNLDALLEENKRTKQTSYEMQIKLMQAYKQLLDAGAQAAQIREDGYKQEITMYAVSLGISAVEIVIYSTPPMSAGAYDKRKCAYWVAGSASISLALGTRMMMAASEAKKKYLSESEKIGNILKKYMDFFNKQHIDRSSLETRLASSTEGIAPINAKTGIEGGSITSLFKNTSLSQSEKQMCEAAPSTSCCNDSSKKCPSFSVTSGNPTISAAIGKADLTGALSRADASLGGTLKLGDKGVSLAVAKDMKRSLAFKNRVLDQLKDQGRLGAEQVALYDTDKQMKAFLKKNYGDENAQLSSSFGDSMALPDVERVGEILEKGEVPNELKNEKKNLTSSFNSLASMSKINNSLSELASDDFENDSYENDLAASSDSELEDDEYIYSKDEIVEKPEVSIFQVISNRYNVLRIKKRFGHSVSN